MANTRSRSLLEGIGMVEEEKLKRFGAEQVIYTLRRPQRTTKRSEEPDGGRPTDDRLT